MYTNKELQDLTEKWGHDRQITINGNIPTQTLKFGEEMGELFEAMSNEMVKDAIGDMLVVLTMVTRLNNTHIFDCLTMEDKGITVLNFPPAERLAANYGRMCSAVVREDHDKLNWITKEFVVILELVAETYGTSINECWNLAYKEIKDRKGTLLANGNFVKEEDNHPAGQTVMKFEVEEA